MSFAILSVGTALPSTTITQQDALGIARALCCRTEEQATWLPVLYGQTGIDTRRQALGADLVRDLLDGTRHSGSPFLPSGADDDRGADARRLHGLPRGAQRAARGPGVHRGRARGPGAAVRGGAVQPALSLRLGPA